MSKLPGVDNFETLLAQNIRGYVSSIDPTIAPADVIVRGSQNVYKSAAGTWVNREGRKQYDVVDTTIAGTKASYVWKTSLGATRTLAIANSKLEVISDIVTTGTFVHYTLLSSLANTRGVFDPWWNNTLKKDQLLFVLGDTSLRMWHGGMGLVSSTTSNTIVLTATVASQGFDTSSGDVLINGNSYAYTGSSASTLTGVTPDPTGEANASVVISAVVVTATTPSSDSNTFTNDFLRVVGNMVYLGSYKSRLIYISSNSSYTTYTATVQSTARVPGGSELLYLDSTAKGIGVRQGHAIIFAGTSDLYEISFEKITVGSTLTEQTVVTPKKLANLASAYAHEFIAMAGDNVRYLGQDQQMHDYGTYRNLGEPVSPILSHEVSTDLFNEDFTLGQLQVISTGDRGTLTYIIAPNTGVVYIYQEKTEVNRVGNIVSERRWFAPFVWGVSRIESNGTSILGFSNSNPQIYTLWDTAQWHDDGPGSGSATIALAYTSVLITSYRNHGRRQGKLRFDKIYWEGFMTSGTSLNGAVYYDYQGATNVLSPIIHSIVDGSPANSQSFFTGIVPPSLGDASLGDNPLGDITAVIYFGVAIRDRDLLPKFRIITGVEITDCYEYSLMMYTSKVDDRWEVIALGANASQSPFNGVELVKTT